ncbi:hypothetical protein AVEN_191985-1 [Araneus ventricosus]|uniref:Uncharacterized protein n=1 Tax=Araneus ventricosus TaxID=182803 RepID=A0A4Y2SIM3_ARAVE|nr:hypothetical protein AVEN_191985-1 [Araneus ventricosus]
MQYHWTENEQGRYQSSTRSDTEYLVLLVCIIFAYLIQIIKLIQYHPTLVPTVQANGGSIMIWDCFNGSGLGSATLCDSKMKLQNRTPSLTHVPVTRPVTERFDGQDTRILFKKKKNKINKKKEIYTLCTAQAFSLLHY